MVYLQHACHKVYVIKYHLVFILKYRKDLFLNEQYVSYLKCLLDEISKRYFLTPETIGIDEDHVHVLMQAAPRYSPSRIVQIVKSITARKMFEKHPGFRKRYPRGEFWSEYEHHESTGRKDMVSSDVYIANQQKHHKIKVIDDRQKNLSCFVADRDTVTSVGVTE